ncbi:MAG TPA: hypothetical protein VGM53_13610 [Streptosporangiaceae bacterium]
MRRNGLTEPDRLMGPTRPGPAEQPPHAAGARCCASGVPWIAPKSWSAAQDRPASSQQQAGHGTAGRCSSGRTRGHGWRIAGRSLVTGGFLLCGWLVTSAGHAAAAETATPAAPHDLVTAASPAVGSGTIRPVLASTASLPGRPSPGSQRPASTLLALPSFPGQAGVGAGNQIVHSVGRRLTRPAAIVTPTGWLTHAVTTAATPAVRTAAAPVSAVASQPGRPPTPAVTPAPPAAARPAPANATAPPASVSSAPAAIPLAARPGTLVGSCAASELIDEIGTAGSSLAAPLLQGLDGQTAGGMLPGAATLPALVSKPVAGIPGAAIPGAAGETTIVPAGVNPGGVSQPAGALPDGQPLMRMASLSVAGPARAGHPAAAAATLAPIPAAAAQLTASWARQAVQQDAGTQQPAIPHRTVPGSGKPGSGAATQTDPVPAGGAAGAAQVAAHVPSGSGRPNPAGWLIRMRMSRSPAGLQRADDPAVSPD